MIAFRPATASDRRFVTEAWMESFRTSYTAGLIPMRTWFVTMRPILEELLDKGGTRTLVAYETNEDAKSADIYGFISANTDITPPCVYFVYVKEPYREAKRRFGRHEGVATSLFREVGIDPGSRFTFACKTRMVSTLARKIPLARFNPLVARFDNPKGD